MLATIISDDPEINDQLVTVIENYPNVPEGQVMVKVVDIGFYWPKDKLKFKSQEEIK